MKFIQNKEPSECFSYCTHSWLLSAFWNSIKNLNQRFVFLAHTIVFNLSFRPQTLVHPVSKTHWDTLWRHSSLFTEICCTSFQVISILFRSWCMVSIQFFLGLPGCRSVVSASQYRAWFGSSWMHLMFSRFRMWQKFKTCWYLRHCTHSVDYYTGQSSKTNEHKNFVVWNYVL